MSALSIQVPFPVFQDRDGQPLDNGYVWLGTSSLNPQTNPVVAYYDSALTIVATQPLRTLNGFISRAGSPAQVYVDAVNFSILVQDRQGTTVFSVPEGTGISPNASGVVYDPVGTGAAATTVQAKLRERVSVLDFGVDNTGVTTCYTPMKAAWDYCLVSGKDLYLPAGTYTITTANNFPFGRIDGSIPSSLLDCLNITIYGDGPATILKTDTVAGADVLQINGAKNLHFKNLKLMSTISGTTAGSNGISVTGGYDNLTFENIWCENLASLDKTTYIDGGKALSIQTPVAGQTVECGTLKATNIFAKGCVAGFDISLDLVAASTKKTSVEVDLVAEDCREAVIVSAGEASGAISANWSMGVRVKAQAINCMRDITAVRAHGVDLDCQVITSKTQAARILNYAGVKWMASDTTAEVQGLYCAYAHNSRIKIYGNKGDCAYKANVGGIAAGSSGLIGATWLTRIEMDLLGTASASEFGAIDSGGNVTLACVFVVKNAASTGDAAHYLPSRDNAILYGTGQVLGKIMLREKISFTYTDGLDTFGAEVGYDDEAITIKQKNSGSVSTRVLKVLTSGGVLNFMIRSDGCIGSNGIASATSVATISKVLPIYDTSNVLRGYVPIYNTYA